MKKYIILLCSVIFVFGFLGRANADTVIWNFDPTEPVSTLVAGALNNTSVSTATFRSGGIDLVVQSVTADWDYGASNLVTRIELGQYLTPGDLGKKITSANGSLVNPPASVNKGLGTGGDNIMTGYTKAGTPPALFSDAYSEWLAFKVPTGYVFTEVKLYGLASDEKVLLQYAQRPNRKYDVDGTTIDNTQIMEGGESAGLGGNAYTAVLIADIIANPTDPAFQWLAVAIQPFGITSASPIFLNYTTYGDFQIASITATTAPVPEPATMFLLGSGLIGVGAFVRRKFKK